MVRFENSRSRYSDLNYSRAVRKNLSASSSSSMSSAVSSVKLVVVVGLEPPDGVQMLGVVVLQCSK